MLLAPSSLLLGLLLPLLPSAPGAGPHGPGADWARHVQLERESPFASLAWRSVGPRMQGGRIECLAVPPGSPATMYVGVGSGNLWKTTNAGTTWTPIFEKESAFAIGDVAVSPSDPHVLWVGTGEVLMARSSFAGTGVFKSEDAGETWKHMGLDDSHHIARVLLDPRDPNVVWVAAIGPNFSSGGDAGLFVTRDGGASWTRSLPAAEGIGAVDVEMDPRDPRVLYATTWERHRRAWGHEAYSAANAVWRTKDGGEHWERLGNGLPAGDDVGRIALALAPSNPDVVYALVTRSGRRGQIWRTADGGEAWALVNDGDLTAGYDFCMLEVAPHDENELWVPLQKLHHSLDGGRTFREVDGTVVHLLDHGARGLHLDSHCMWIDPRDPAHLIVGNDGGVYVTHDRGATWLHLNNMPLGEFYAVGVDMAAPYRIYGGTQDNAALVGPSDGVPADGTPDPWEHVYLDPWGGGDSFFTVVDPRDPNLIYYEHQFGDLRRKDRTTGETEWIQPHDQDGRPLFRTNWQTPFFFSAHDPGLLYYGADRLLRSADRGDTWTPISPDLTTDPGPERRGNVPFGTITTLSESPLDPALLYVGTDDGNVQVTRDGSASWTLVDAGLPEKWVTRVTASAHRRGTVYLTQSGYVQDDFAAYVFRSDDFGATWTSLAANLPAEPVNVLREDPTDERILYLGTDLGVYVSLDRGGAWHSLCATLPTTPVRDLVVHPRDGELVIGTHGRSVWVLDVAPVRAFAERTPHCVLVQPIEVTDDAGVEAAKMNIVEPLIDGLYRTAGVDYHFLEPIRFASTDALEGWIDVNDVIVAARAAGAMRGEGEVIHVFFVRAINGRPAPNGLGQQPGAVVFAAQAAGAEGAQDAFVVAHETGHNLGLPHAVDDPTVPNDVPNVMGDGPFALRVSPTGIVPSQIEKVLASPLVRPRLEFLDADAAYRVVIDDPYEPFLEVLQRREIMAMTGAGLDEDDLDACREEARARFASGLGEFAENEEAALTALVRELEGRLSPSFPLLFDQPWRFVKLAPELCGGFPHTRGTCIVFSDDVVARITTMVEDGGAVEAARRIGPLLVHEKLHVLQRLYPRRFARLYTDHWGFVEADIRPDPWIVARQISNPDGLALPWLARVGEGEGARTYWMRTLIDDEPALPQMGRDFVGVAFVVEERDGVFEVVHDGAGLPVQVAMDELPAYAARFPTARGLDHPHEIAAYCLAELVGAHYVVDRSAHPIEARLAEINAWLRQTLR